MSLLCFKTNQGKPLKFRKYYKDLNVIDYLSTAFAQLLFSLDKTMSRPLVVVGVGTDRSTGDSLGPLVGHMLLNKNISYQAGFEVYGTLSNPVHAVNLEKKLQEINKLYSEPLIIGIDACLGKTDSIGYITLAEGPLRPGIGVKKQLPEVGQLHFTGIVNVGGYLEYFVLQNTRLNLVMSMAEITSSSIAEGINKLNILKENQITL